MAVYDEEDKESTSSAATPGMLSNAENNPSSSTPGEKTDPAKSPTDKGSAVNEDGGLFNSGKDSPKGGPKSAMGKLLWGSRRRKQSTVIGGGAIGGILTVSVFGLIFTAGSAQLIQLSNILQRPFSHSDNTQSVRANGLLRYAKTGETGETRLGYLGSKYFGSIRSQLADAGITFKTNGINGSIQSTEMDTDKLSSRYPELKGMDNDQAINFFAETFKANADQIKYIGKSSDGGSLFATDDNTITLRMAVAIKDFSVSLLPGGRIQTGIQSRFFGKFFDIPSIFHPIQRLVTQRVKTNIVNTAQSKIDQQQADQATTAENDKISSPALTPEEATAEADMGSKLGTGQKVLGSALLLTAGICLVRSLANDIPAVNRAAIVAPSIAHATATIATGQQIQNNSPDISTQQINSTDASLSDNTGTVWEGQALSDLENPNNYSGQAMPLQYAQGFSTSTTTAAIDNTLGASGFGDLACSPGGKVVQVGLGLGLLVSGFLDAGASWGAKLAFVGGQLTELAATSGVFKLISTLTVTALKDSAVLPKVFSGPLGGNLLAYGARAGANMSAIASGGVALGNTASTLLGEQELQQENAAFQSKSLAYRLFNEDDPKSLAGHFVQSVSPNVSQNFNNVATDILNFNVIKDVFHNLASIFSPKVSAQSQEAAYNWGFPQYGIPDSVLNNPDYSDPYANADAVASLLDSSNGQTYINKAATCFGDTIAKTNGLWGVTTTSDVNPDDASYINAGCNSTDPNWERIMLFVNDTRDMESINCYTGGSDSDQSCSDVGYNNGGSSGGSDTPQTLNANNAAAEQVVQNLTANGVNIGYSMYDSNGNQDASYNATFENYGASITKSMILVAYLNQVGSNALSQQATTELTNMIENSDNASANWVYGQLSNGPSEINQVATNAGMTGFILDDTSDPVYVLGQSQITANDFAQFFAKINTLINSSQQSFGLNLLSNLSPTDQVGLLKAGLPGTVYSKEGWKPEPSGTEGAPYIVNQAAQFTDDGTTYGIAVTVAGAPDQQTAETYVQQVVSALVGSASGND